MIEIGSVWETHSGIVVVVEKITEDSVYVRNAYGETHRTCAEKKKHLQTYLMKYDTRRRT